MDALVNLRKELPAVKIGESSPRQHMQDKRWCTRRDWLIRPRKWSSVTSQLLYYAVFIFWNWINRFLTSISLSLSRLVAVSCILVCGFTGVLGRSFLVKSFAPSVFFFTLPRRFARSFHFYFLAFWRSCLVLAILTTSLTSSFSSLSTHF